MAQSSRSKSAKRSNSAASKRKGGRGAQRSRLQNVLRWTLIVALAGTIALLAVFFLAYKFTKVPSPNSAFEAQASYVTYAGGKQRIGQFADQNRSSVPLSEISRSDRGRRPVILDQPRH